MRVQRLFAILCINHIGQQTLGLKMSQQSHEQLNAQSHNMIQSLLGSELDLKAYMYDDSQKAKDDTDVQVEQQSEEDQESDQEEDDDEEEEEEPQDDKKVQVKNASKEQSKFGRDQNGLFKNHKNYMKLRNKINEQENSHSEMFETITKKLTDHNFIQSAIELSSEIEEKGKSASKTKTKSKGKNFKEDNSVSSQAEAGMSDADVKCYEKKFSDLEGKNGREHFLEYGQDLSRWNHCGGNLTSFMSQRYLDTNPDLQHKFGRSSEISRTLAAEHYVDYGYKEDNRSIAVPTWDEIWYGGLTDEFNQAEVNCHGKIHWGYANSPLDGSQLDTFEAMRDYKTYTKESQGGWVWCDHHEFGTDNYHEQMQCFCEPTPQVVPATCADDGDDCLCNGVVYYMKKMNKINSPYDFWDAMPFGYTLNQVNNTNHIKCTRSNFEDVNPLPGDDKVCMCDQQNLQMSVEEQWQIKEYWRIQMEAAWIKEQEITLIEEQRIEHERIIQEQNLKQEQLEIKIKAQDASMKKIEAEQDKEDAKAKEEAEQALKDSAKEREAMEKAAKEKLKKAKEAYADAEKKKEEARKKKAAALKESHEEKKNEMLEDAKKAEEEAIKAAKDAAQDEADAKNDEQVAKLKAKSEKEAKEAAKKAEIDKIQREKDRKKTLKDAEVAEQKEDAAGALAEDKAREEHAIALELKYEQEMEDSIVKQREMIAARYATEQSIIKKKQERRLKQEAKLAEQRRRAEVAAEKKRLEQEAEEARQKAEEEALEAELKRQEDAQIDEKRRLEKEEHDKNIAAQKAKDALIASQKSEQIASTQGAITDAQNAEKAAQDALTLAQENKQRIVEERNRIKEEIEKKKAQKILLEERKKQNKKAKEVAIKMAKIWKEKALAAKKSSEKAAEKAENEFKQFIAKMKATIEANEKAHAAIIKKKQETFIRQQATMREAHEAAEEARIRREEAAIAKHKKEMADKRKDFERRFKHVWTTGPAGISKFYVTAPTQQSGEKLIADLLSETIVADVKQQNVDIHRKFVGDPDYKFGVHKMDYGQLQHRTLQHRIIGVTNDDRVAELIEMVAAHKIGSKEVPFDCIIVPIVNGSPDYLEWIELQTMKKDPALAHYNINPEDEMVGLNNAVGKITHVEDIKPQNQQTVQFAQGDDKDDEELSAQDEETTQDAETDEKEEE